MKKTRFSESQIVAILKEVELGAKVSETCRKHGVSEPTYYKWKSQFSGMTVPHLAQLRELQDENARLKRMRRPPVFITDDIYVDKASSRLANWADQEGDPQELHNLSQTG